MSFLSAGKTFILVTLHVIYGQPKERIPELEAIAEWLSEWAKNINKLNNNHNLIALGDFNIDREDDELYDAFISTGLEVPKDLLGLPRTIFKTDGPKDVTFYDRIAWFDKEGDIPALSLKYSRGGNFDFTKTALKSLNLSIKELS